MFVFIGAITALPQARSGSEALHELAPPILLVPDSAGLDTNSSIVEKRQHVCPESINCPNCCYNLDKCCYDICVVRSLILMNDL